MASTQTATRTTDGFFNLPGGTATGPCLLEAVLVSAPTDTVVITLYDLAALDASAVPAGTGTLLDQVIVAVGTSDSFYIGSIRAYKGLYLKINSGTTPRVTCYVR